jgi:hypothetical protein
MIIERMRGKKTISQNVWNCLKNIMYDIHQGKLLRLELAIARLLQPNKNNKWVKSIEETLKSKSQFHLKDDAINGASGVRKSHAVSTMGMNKRLETTFSLDRLPRFKKNPLD